METISNAVPIGERIAIAMHAAGIKSRSFATLVGCHYTTIYSLIGKKSFIPVPVMQDKIHDVADFLEDAVKRGTLPLPPDTATTTRTILLASMYQSYTAAK